MRALLLLLLAGCLPAQRTLLPVVGQTSNYGASSCAAGYAHCKQITLGTITGTLSNWPVYVTTTLGGSKINNASCYDVAFSASQDGSTPYDFELVPPCSAAAGTVSAWVRIPSAASSGTFWLHYGGSGSTNPSVTTTWNSDFHGVWHLGDGSTLSLTDSTNHGETLTNNNAATTTAGPNSIAGSVVLASASSQSLTHADNANLSITGALTLMAWVRATSLPGADGGLISKYVTTSNQRAYMLDLMSTGAIRGAVSADGTAYKQLDSSGTISTATWYLISYVFTPSTSVKVVIDTTATSNTTSVPASAFDGTADFAIGKHTAAYFNGRIAEPRLIAGAMSDGWIAACYDNQVSAAWLTFGAEQ